MAVTLADLGVIADVAQQLDSDPVTLLGRIVGLSPNETRAGVPVWAWVAIACGAGIYVGWRYGDDLPQKLLARRRAE